MFIHKLQRYTIMNEQPEINFNNHAQALAAKRNYWRKIIKE